MIDFLNTAFSYLNVGNGLGLLLLAYALYRMARHEVLLFGSVEPRHDTAGPIPTRYHYRFFIQNLEEVTFPGHFDVVIRDRRSTRNCNDPLQVDLFAGPRHVSGGPQLTPSDDPNGCTREWVATFEQLSPFDTWLFVCTTPSTWLELEILTRHEKHLLPLPLIVNLTPRKIGLQADAGVHTVFEGTRITPAMDILISIAISVVCFYLGSIYVLQQWREQLGLLDFGIRPYDAVVIGLLVLALWVGYRRMQRPVYPIIQGYFFPTPVDPALPPKDSEQS